jgi:hypothetical protein
MRAHALALMIVASPAIALDPATLSGLWRGEGVLTLPGEPDQRLRCDLRFRSAQASGRDFLLGRCATAQGSQAFHYRLQRTGPGTLSASRQPEAPEDLPETLAGQMEGDTLRLFSSEVEFLLTRTPEGLTFSLSAPGQGGTANATLTRRSD